MKGSGRQQFNMQGQGQGRGRANCRSMNTDSLATGDIGLGRSCRDIALPSENGIERLTSESVEGGEKRFFGSNLQMLKDQAARLSSALQKINSQIQALERR